MGYVISGSGRSRCGIGLACATRIASFKIGGKVRWKGNMRWHGLGVGNDSLGYTLFAFRLCCFVHSLVIWKKVQHRVWGKGAIIMEIYQFLLVGHCTQMG